MLLYPASFSATLSEVVFDVMMEEEHPPLIQELPFSLLPYPQMIMEAIEASNDARGCSKTAILKHIETTQTHLPPSHLTLLDYHLNQMKHSGQIVIVKNNYMKPDPNPKRQGDSSHVADTTSPYVYSLRVRGRRPPSLTEEKAKVPPSVSGRPRGRPPKKKKQKMVQVGDKTQGNNGVNRGRGRQPKMKLLSSLLAELA